MFDREQIRDLAFVRRAQELGSPGKRHTRSGRWRVTKNIVIYFQHGDQAKEYLSQRGIRFQQRDVAQDPSALADLKELGYMTTPVIVVDGAVIVGFDAERIDRALYG